MNGTSGMKFTLDIYDREEPDTADVFMIQIPGMDGYLINGTVSGGNIKINK